MLTNLEGYDMSKTKGDVVKDLREMLEDGQINLNEDDLYEASADRYKKYARAKKALNVPMPTAIVYPYTTGEVQKLLRYYNENRINVIPRSGNTATEGGLENWKELTIVIDAKNLNKIIYVFLTIFLYLLKCPQSLILSALRAFCFCGKPHISRSIFLYFRYQAWLKSW